MRRIGLLLIGLALGACSSVPPPSFYKLDAVAVAGPSASAITIVVGPVTIPPMVDRPQIVVNDGANQVRPLESRRWAAPLADSIAQVIARNLSQLLGAPKVWVYPQPVLPKPDVQVVVQIQRFESTPGTAVSIDTLWSVRKGATGDDVRIGRSDVREPCAEGGFDALAAAHSRALARISQDIAAAIANARP